MQVFRPGSLALILLLAGLTFVTACPVQYSGDGLLFGGVGDRCVKGCRTRSSEVSRTCGFQGQQDDVWGLCSPQQRLNNQREHSMLAVAHAKTSAAVADVAAVVAVVV